MGTEFLTAGDLFVEVVDNADASDPPIRDESRMAAIKDGTFEDGPFRFDRYTGYNGIRQLYSRHGPAGEHLRRGRRKRPQFRVCLRRRGIVVSAALG